MLQVTHVIREQFGNVLLVYMYDESGSPIGMQCRAKNSAEGVFDTYYFEKNLQGDIIAVYDASGTKLISYTYDAWGVHTVTNHVQNVGAAQYNPFRYRGYYYDADLGLYYLNSRYYDPNTGRFINADAYVSTGQGILGFNPFAYCRNEPVSREDSLGTSDICVTNINEDDNPFNDLGGYFYGCGGGASAYYGYDSSAYGSYLIKSATANYDADLGGYYSGGGSSYNIGNYIIPGAVTVTDDMATNTSKSKMVRNPDGRKGGKAHQSKIQDLASPYLNNPNYVVKYEAYIQTAGGYKPYRYADIAITNHQTGEVSYINVGIQLKSGIPCARERYAIWDIESTGRKITFVPYN